MLVAGVGRETKGKPLDEYTRTRAVMFGSGAAYPKLDTNVVERVRERRVRVNRKPSRAVVLVVKCCPKCCEVRGGASQLSAIARCMDAFPYPRPFPRP